MKNKQLRRIIVLLLLGCCLVVIGFIINSGKFPIGKNPDDFIAFWSSGRLLSIGADPYSPEHTMELSMKLGFGEVGKQLSYFYPPWTLPIFIPFSLLSFPLSRTIWLFVSIVTLSSCAMWIWSIYHGPIEKKWVIIFCIVLISPGIFALYEGQVTPLILLGIVGFLYFVKKEMWYFAGAMLALTTFKPQVLYLFWVALFFWLIYTKHWQIIAGLALTILVFTLIVIIIDPMAINQFIQTNANISESTCHNPTISSVICRLTNHWESWYLLIGPIIGLSWLIYYWLRNKDEWTWSAALPMLIFISIMTAPYTWMHDGLLFIIAVLQILILFLVKGISSREYIIIGKSYGHPISS